MSLSIPSQTPSVIDAIWCNSGEHLEGQDSWLFDLVVCHSLNSEMRRPGAEYLLLDSGAQIHACPIKYPGEKSVIDRPWHPHSERITTQTRRWTLGQIHASARTNDPSSFSCLRCAETYSFLGCLAKQGSWSDLRADTGALYFPDNSQIPVHKKGSLFFVKGKLISPSNATGVSDDVVQELQVPIGPQAASDVEEPMPCRAATLRDLGTPDQIVVEQHNVTHFPSQPWCKEGVECRGRDSPHREQSNIDAVVPPLQFDFG